MQLFIKYNIYIKGVQKKTRPPKSLKGSKSNMIRARKLKHSQPVYHIKKTDCKLFSFLAQSVSDLKHFKDLDGLFLLDTLYIYLQTRCSRGSPGAVLKSAL